MEVLELLLLRVVLVVHTSRRGRAWVHVTRGAWVVGAGVVVDGHALLRRVPGVRVCGRHPSRELWLLAAHGSCVVHSPGGARRGVVLQVGVER